MTISNEAVERAADYLPHSMDCEPRPPERDCTCRHLRVATMSAALEAAAPIIRAEALEAAAKAMREERQSWCLDDAGRYWIKRTLDDLAARAVAERGGQ